MIAKGYVLATSSSDADATVRLEGRYRPDGGGFINLRYHVTFSQGDKVIAQSQATRSGSPPIETLASLVLNILLDDFPES